MASITDYVVVALGSNLGESKQILEAAIERLGSFSRTPVLRSRLWRTAPVDCPPGSPDFVNAVVAFIPLPHWTPETLLQELQTLEHQFGRTPKKVLNEARPLDLDLIAFQNQTRASNALTLPHPRASTRRFVLQPLSEILPDLILPGQALTVAQHLEALPSSEVITPL